MLRIRDLHKSFGSVKVIDNFNKDFDSGHIYLLTGCNGSGKTTLLKIIKGSLQLDKGEINIALEPRDHKITYVDSNSRSFLHRLSVKENLFYFMALDKKNRDLEKIRFFLSVFEQENLLDRNFALLSAGQMQIIAIIRGLLEDPRILILDEATSALDNSTEELIMESIKDFDPQITILVIAHRLNTLKYCNKIFELNDGILLRKA